MALLAWAACSHFTQGCPHPTNSRQVCQASQASHRPVRTHPHSLCVSLSCTCCLTGCYRNCLWLVLFLAQLIVPKLLQVCLTAAQMNAGGCTVITLAEYTSNKGTAEGHWRNVGLLQQWLCTSQNKAENGVSLSKVWQTAVSPFIPLCHLKSALPPSPH